MASILNATTSSGLVTSADNSGSLQLATNNGTTAVTIDTSQNVGIGTSSPAAPIDVVSNSSAIGLSVRGRSDNAGVIRWMSNDGTTVNGRIQVNSGGDMIFQNTNSITERMRITSSGDLLVGATATSRTGQSRIKSTGTQSSLLVECSGATVASGALEVAASSAPSNTSNYLIIGTTSAVDKFYVYSNGNVVNANNSYGSLSDVTLKENIVDATPKLDKINSVRVVNYNLIGDEQKQIGVIAQELETVFPSMVDTDGKSGLKQVKYSVFIPILIKAIQEQQAMIEELKAEVQALKGVK